MQTYRQFLIHLPHVYLDQGGNLTRMFGDFQTIEAAQSRIDQHWDTQEQFEHLSRVNLGRSFEILKADTDLHDEAQQLDSEKWSERVENYESLKLMEDK